MQPKICVFFKSPAHVPKSVGPVSAIHGKNDEVAIWEKKEHHIFNMYEQRHLDPKIIQDDREGIHQIKKSIPVESCSKQESILTGRMIIKHKRRSYAQFHLDFGQSDFLLHNCSICGVKFAPDDAEDEKEHKKFHKTYTQGLPFKVEEVVKMMEIDLGIGWIIHENCKVYPFISLQRIVGYLVAEPIKEAFKVISCLGAGSCDGTRKKEMNPSSTTLQFGDIIF